MTRFALRVALAAAAASVVRGAFSGLLSFYCNLSYPIDSANLVADYDVNCNWDASAIVTNYVLHGPNADGSGHALWSRVNNDTVPPVVLPSVTRSTINDRSVYYLTLASDNQLQFPINISPSAMPNASVELLVSFTAGTSANKFLWSAGNTTGYSSNATKPRAFMIYDGAGEGAYMSVMGPGPYAASMLANPSASVYTHIVVAFGNSTRSGFEPTATVYVNGVYADSRPGLRTVDGLNFTNFGGVFGNPGFGPTILKLVYFRVWNRTLAQADAVALSTGSPAGATGVMATTPFILYTRPLWSQPFAVCGVQPTVGGTYSSSPGPSISGNLLHWVVNRTALVQIAGTGPFVPSTTAAATAVFQTGTVTSPNPAMTGNASYMIHAWTTLQPSATYIIKFPSIPDNRTIWYGESKSTARCSLLARIISGL